MIITCECKKYKYLVNAEDIGPTGRLVQCGMCSKQWFQEAATNEQIKTSNEIQKQIAKQDNNKKLSPKNVPAKYNEKQTTFDIVFSLILVAVLCLIVISDIFRKQILNFSQNFNSYYDILDLAKEYIDYCVQRILNMLNI